MRTITAPGVEIKEIDKSQYSQAMTGTACYVMGFSDKGEPYKPMEFTSRTAFTSYYGEPDNEAERYFYAAACEVLNQNGRLYTARLPYDNDAFEKMVAIDYKFESVEPSYISDDNLYTAIKAEDKKIAKYLKFNTNGIPELIDLATVDEYRTDEAKVPFNHFKIIDTTGSTYKKIEEDDRKGKARELLGIVPIVTTAANAMFAQRLIERQLSSISPYESIAGDRIYALKSSSDSNSLRSSDFARPLRAQPMFECASAVVSTFTNYYIADKNSEISSIEIFKQRLSANLKDSVIDCAPSGLTCESFGSLTDLTSSTMSNILSGISVDFDSIISCTEKELYENFSDPEIDVSLTANDDSKICYVFKYNHEIAKTSSEWEWHGISGDDDIPESLALDAANFFPTIQPSQDLLGFDREFLKDIGVVVYRIYMDPTEGNKVSYEPVEAFAGSLCKDDKDPATGVTKFIDTIINTQSQYINFFSNCFSTPKAKKTYIEECDILIAEPSPAATLGFYSDMTAENISISKSIYDGMNKCFDKVSDVIERDIDIVPDAGISNIASYLMAIYGNPGLAKPYDLTIVDELGNSLLGLWKAKTATDSAMKTWRAVVQKIDNFCKNIRKDCMFTTDCPRPLVLQGQKKIIRDTKPKNTIDADILPYLKVVAGLNTSYGAGYLDWFEQPDDYTGELFWVPPSIKAMGAYIYTDVNYNYWDAPAGLTRGVISATDVAFSPNPKQAGAIYEKCWNYAINYPLDGIVLEGQKTLQTKPTALDRVNVRRLCLRLERAVFKSLRWFIYEGNTAYLRQRVIDTLNPYFDAAVRGGGLYDYKIICDDSNNKSETIDRHELHVSIGIKPVKTVEFILVDFIIGRTGASWAELGL